MAATLSEFHQLTDAEQYFEFFGLVYDRKVVNVNRLHILKKFSNVIRQIDDSSPSIDDSQRLALYRTALIESYELFLASTGVEQKLFKVFHEKPHNVVLLGEINAGQ